MVLHLMGFLNEIQIEDGMYPQKNLLLQSLAARMLRKQIVLRNTVVVLMSWKRALAGTFSDSGRSL